MWNAEMMPNVVNQVNSNSFYFHILYILAHYTDASKELLLLRLII